MLNTNSDILRRVVQADLNLQPRSSACWTAQLLSAFQGLRGCELYERAVQTGHAITIQEFTADLKHRMRGVWRDAELVDPNTHNNKLAIYHSWFAIPFSRNERMPINVPRYLHLDLSKHVLRKISRFRLRAHTLKVEAAAWLEDGSCVCDLDFFFFFWAYGFICGWPRPVSSRSAKQPGWRSPPIVTIEGEIARMDSFLFVS